MSSIQKVLHLGTSSENVQKLLKLYNIEVFESAIKEIKGEAKELQLDGFELKDGTFVAAGMAFVSLGMIIYNDLAKQLNTDLDDRGFVKTANRGESTVEAIVTAENSAAQVRPGENAHDGLPMLMDLPPSSALGVAFPQAHS